MKHLHRMFLCAFTLLLLIPTIGPAHAGSLIIHDLGTLGGARSLANAVSDSGSVVGSAQTASGQFVAFMFTLESGMRQLPIPEGASHAVDVSSGGHVIGFDSLGGFLLSSGVLIRLPSLGGAGGMETVPTGLNARGDVVGVARNSSSGQNAFLYSRGSNENLAPTSTQSIAYGISNSGRVVGTASYGSSNGRAVEFTSRAVIDLGTDGEALAITDSGVIVVRGTTLEGLRRAFVRTSAGIRFLDTPGDSTAEDVNNRGHVVGTFYDAATVPHAFLFNGIRLTQLDGLPEVQAAGWTVLYTAKGINDAGWIVGTGLRNGQEHAYLIIPWQ